MKWVCFCLSIRVILHSEPFSEHAYFLICALYNRASHSTSCTVPKKTPFIDDDTILFFLHFLSFSTWSKTTMLRKSFSEVEIIRKR